jgi:DNA-binding MarR family transcriptional regulator
VLFNDCLCFQLGKALRKVTKAYREEIADFGLTHGQFFLIVAIMEEEGLLPSELADKTCQDRPTITGLLDRLERENWIERRPDPEDRRSLRIYLTSRASELKAPVLDLFQKTNRKLLRRFSPEEWKQIQSFLDRLEE